MGGHVLVNSAMTGTGTGTPLTGGRHRWAPPHRGIGMDMEWGMTGAVRTERGGFTVVTGSERGGVYCGFEIYSRFVFL